jgi:hypothetical protein
MIIEDLPSWVPLVIGLVTGVALVVLPRIAPLTKTTIDDKAAEFIKEFGPKIQAWADPKSDDVPPTPTNPEGKA